MPRSPRLEALIDRLLAAHSPLIREAFTEAMRDARDSVRLQDVVDALARGDVAAAARALEIQRAFLAPLDQALSAAYFAAGQAHNEELMRQIRSGGLTLVIRFDPGHPRAAGWVRQHSSNLITEIVESQRTAVREVLGVGLDAGRNPRTVALDIVGRMDKATKRRVGGIIGLTSGQAQSVANAQAQLASGDPAQMREYLERKLRDRRFDGVVRRAMREGHAVGALDVQRIVARYSDRMLKYRGDVIGRTETLTALSYSQHEATTQMLEASGVRPGQIRKEWRARLDGRTRDSHVALNGTKIELTETFRSPATGARMRFPRDGSLGASGEDLIQCRCYLTQSFNWGDKRGLGTPAVGPTVPSPVVPPVVPRPAPGDDLPVLVNDIENRGAAQVYSFRENGKRYFAKRITDQAAIDREVKVSALARSAGLKDDVLQVERRKALLDGREVDVAVSEFIEGTSMDKLPFDEQSAIWAKVPSEQATRNVLLDIVVAAADRSNSNYVWTGKRMIATDYEISLGPRRFAPLTRNQMFQGAFAKEQKFGDFSMFLPDPEAVLDRPAGREALRGLRHAIESGNVELSEEVVSGAKRRLDRLDTLFSKDRVTAQDLLDADPDMLDA